MSFEHREENKNCSVCRESVRVTFEHKHENKSCPACREREVVGEKLGIRKIQNLSLRFKIK